MIKRFSVSLDEKLLEQLDSFIELRGYGSRSEAVRDLIRKEFVQEEWQQDGEVAGVITIVYNHHQPQLQEKITEIQHHFYFLITSTTHVHMEHHNCLEVIIVKGAASSIRELAATISALRGVKNGNLSMSSTGKELY